MDASRNPAKVATIVSQPGGRDTGTAPDGSLLEFLLRSDRGTMAKATFEQGTVSQAVRHQTVQELWYFLSGRGQMWMGSPDGESTFDVGPGTAVQIPVGTSFQFKVEAGAELQAVFVTIPPWPGKQEAELVDGIW